MLKHVAASITRNSKLSRIRGVVANYLASQARDLGIDSHQHQKDSWHIWRHLRSDTVFSCNLRCLLIFLHGRSRTYRVASLRAGPVGRISYNLYFDCIHVRYVTCDFNKRIPTMSQDISKIGESWKCDVYIEKYHNIHNNCLTTILLIFVIICTLSVHTLLSAPLRSNGGRLCFATVYFIFFIFIFFFIHRSFSETTRLILTKFSGIVYSGVVWIIR